MCHFNAAKFSVKRQTLKFREIGMQCKINDFSITLLKISSLGYDIFVVFLL